MEGTEAAHHLGTVTTLKYLKCLAHQRERKKERKTKAKKKKKK